MVTITDARGQRREIDPFMAGCPSRRVLDLIGDRWTVLIVGALGDDVARFSELKRRIGGISQKMLTQTLREMERDGLVERTVYPQVPVRVEYRLTAGGLSLREPLGALFDWAVDHFGDIDGAQQRFDVVTAGAGSARGADA